MKNKRISWLSDFLLNFPLTLLSILLFVLSHPNFIYSKGFFFLAFFTYIPVLLCVHKSGFKTVWLQGFLFGSLSYGLYAYWVHASYPEFIPVIYIGCGLIYSLLFIGLKLLDKFYRKNGWVSQWLLICIFEYIRTLGFLGMSYGVTAYTQWTNLYFIQIADITGIHGINAVIILFSAIVYSLIQKHIDQKAFIKRSELSLKNNGTNLKKYLEDEALCKLFSRRTTYVALGVWCVCFIGIYLYGFFSVKDYSQEKSLKVTAIQNNENSWLDGIDVYTKNIYELMKLTDEALELNPETELVVWPETSVVPAIVGNYYEPVDKKRGDLIKYLLQFINSKDCEFIVGNGHKGENSRGKKVLYNSALKFEPGYNVIPPNPDVYSKMKLVPFSEYFPYEKQFPKIYNKLKEKGLLNWEKGRRVKVFRIKKMYATSLICYEDTFPEVGREHYLNGSRCFICISNDSWSKSRVCQNQHLSIALFRSIENRVPSVRCTASGSTCFIDPNGKIIKNAPDFCEAYISGNVPVLSKDRKPTLYTLYGDYIVYGEMAIFVLLLIIQTINCIIISNSKSKKVKSLTR